MIRRTRRVRKRLLELLQQGHNISQACAAVGIGRRTFYTWLQQDAGFREAVDAAYTRLIATAERTLQQAIEAGDTRAAMWLLERLAPEYRLHSTPNLATPNLAAPSYTLEFEVVDAPQVDLGELEQLIAAKTA